MIRRRVTAGAVALFVATWLLITVTLATGHDPVLATRTRTVASTHETAKAKTSTAASTTTATATSSTPSSVSTRQS
jgi:hypothetical protein